MRSKRLHIFLFCILNILQAHACEEKPAKKQPDLKIMIPNTYCIARLTLVQNFRYSSSKPMLITIVSAPRGDLPLPRTKNTFNFEFKRKA